MTYVREQTSAELAAHIRSLQKMAGWFDPLSDRLWQEVEALQAEVAGLKTGYEAYERVNAELRAECEALRKALAECSDSLYGEMLQKFGGQLPDDMHPVTRRLYERDMASVTEARAAMGKGEQP
ncbi:hypothetical protein ACI77I_21975 [Pseudomonas sp. D47]|uniref:hypothetical protein n=1 Tax=Pseudomonas sp. D47 TaxID=3159447 RepID=UPI00387B079F